MKRVKIPTQIPVHGNTWRLTTGKNEKKYSLHVSAMKFIGMLQIYLKNYDLCKYVKFGEISWKFDILSVTASFKFESKNHFVHVWHI